jgi:hypothetical protein
MHISTQQRNELMKAGKRCGTCFSIILVLLSTAMPAFPATAPSDYSGYTGTDPKPIPSPPPRLGPANSISTDPTFGSRILRVTDANTAGGRSVIPEDAGFFRAWNANSTALKLMTPKATWWVEFDPGKFTVGGGSSRPSLHQLNLNRFWEWSAVDPDILYFLNGNQIGQYNKATDKATNLGGPSNGDPVTYHVAVVGQDTWICSVAGAGAKDTYTKLFCINPADHGQSKVVDIVNRTINGIVQSDPNWPTSAPGHTIGIHSITGSAGGAWLGITFVHQSWGGHGIAVLNLNTNSWSLATGADRYWAGHIALGNGKLVNGCGSINGRDSRGAVLRDPDNLMDPSKYVFVMQPTPAVGWFDAEHSSWFNASTNPNAPILFSRYSSSSHPNPVPWYGEIVMAATNGRNTVWRFAHNHNGSGKYYGQAFAQISSDGRWASFSSYWDGTLGRSNGDFGIGTRIDTFIVELR